MGLRPLLGPVHGRSNLTLGITRTTSSIEPISRKTLTSPQSCEACYGRMLPVTCGIGAMLMREIQMEHSTSRGSLSPQRIYARHSSTALIKDPALTTDMLLSNCWTRSSLVQSTTKRVSIFISDTRHHPHPTATVFPVSLALN